MPGASALSPELVLVLPEAERRRLLAQLPDRAGDGFLPRLADARVVDCRAAPATAAPPLLRIVLAYTAMAVVRSTVVYAAVAVLIATISLLLALA